MDTVVDRPAQTAPSPVHPLLDYQLPSYRQAYSDRSAWLMACLSELAYLRFNPVFSGAAQQQHFLDTLSQLVDEQRQGALLKLIDLVGYDHEQERRKLVAELGALRLELMATFDCRGTQAILVANAQFAVLAFRGTEATSVRDIKADARAVATACESGGRVHAGFNRAYEQVAGDIQRELAASRLRDKPLYITGHSLGGALATIAAKRLNHPAGIAACYSFGAPRVGDEDWVAGIKAPVYRLVNAADCVTMLPPGTEIITIVAALARFIPGPGGSPAVRAWLLAKFGGYLHGGNMRYLTNCPVGDFNSVKLLYHVSLFYRLKGLIIKKLPWKHFLGDHAISVYRKKLAVVAERRNQ